MRKNKTGVSAVVATVLIVMITVAAVGLLWAIVAPFLKTNVQDKTSCVDASVSLDIDKDSAFTCGNETATSVRVERGSDTANIVGIQIKYIKDDGDSSTQDFYTPEILTNTEKVFRSNATLAKNTTGVAIAAIIGTDGDNITCDALPTVTISRTC